jgi:hypothetical protein
MSGYYIFEANLSSISAYTYSKQDIASRDALWDAKPCLGTFLTKSLLYINDKYKNEHGRYGNYVSHLESKKYSEVKIPTIGLMPEEGQSVNVYKPNGNFMDYIELGSGYWFVSRQMKELLDRHEVASEFRDAYIEIKGQRQCEDYYLWTPLVALDALDKKKSIFQMESATDQDILERVRPPKIEKVQKLVLDYSNIIDKTPFFLVGFCLPTIALIRQDIAEEIQSLGYTGMEFKRIEDCEWMY